MKSRQTKESNLEKASYVGLAIAALIAIVFVVMSISAAVIMVGWGLIAPLFGLPLLDFPAAFGMVIILTVIGWFVKR